MVVPVNQRELMGIAEAMSQMDKIIAKNKLAILTVGENKAATEAAYDIALRDAIIKREKAGEPQTNIEKKAKGDIAEQNMAKVGASCKWAGLMKALEIDCQRLSALQSKLRRFEEMLT